MGLYGLLQDKLYINPSYPRNSIRINFSDTCVDKVSLGAGGFAKVRTVSETN
jgi:hypothetical protein